MHALISDKKYEELKKVFHMMSPKQALVVAALATERLWNPFVDGISDCGYTEQERQEVLKLEKAIQDIIWTYILSEDPQVDRWEKFCESYDQIEALSAEVDLNFMAKPYYCAIVDLASWCLKGNRAENADRMRPDIVVGPLDLIIECVVAKNTPCHEDDAFDSHPAVRMEIERIDADIQMAEEYPANMERLLQRRAEYHVLNISRI